MKKAVLWLLCFTMLMCTGCASQSEGLIPQKPWPSHAPGTSPYIRVPERQPQNTESESVISLEEYLDSLYVRENNFLFLDWELEMFKALPQDEPFSFTVHLFSLADYGSNDNDLKTAEEFASLGADAQVKAYTHIEDGVEETSYSCFVRCTPAELWEMSSRTQELYFIEQQYETVAQRFDTHIWPTETEADHG